MKVQINCPKCRSTKVDITSEEKSPVPMYRCRNCGYKNKLFPGFESDKKMTEDEEDELEEEIEDFDEETENY